MINRHLEDKTFFINEAFTLGDIATSSACRYLKLMGFSFGDWPNIDRWYNNIIERASWQRIIKESEPFIAKLMK